MPRCNRVTPFGDFEATPARGLLMGNRGILHDSRGVLGSSRWQHKNWVACTLSYGSTRREIMKPGNYTELFFCDEAVSLAAGHRPCWQCRRPDFQRFMTAWRKAHDISPDGKLKADDVDKPLHRARVGKNKEQIRTPAALGNLPNGTFISLVRQPSAAWLVWQGSLRRWSHDGYTDRLLIQADENVLVITPEPTVRVLAAGYTPAVHSSATE